MNGLIVWVVVLTLSPVTIGLFLSGRTSLKVLPLIEYHCQQIAFSTFFPSTSINIQLSILESGATFTYEASVSWIELVKQTGFTGCVATSGPISSHRLVTLQWMAFDGVPNKGMMGNQAVSLWTTGTKCVTVDLVGMTFSVVPYIFLTPVHSTPDYHYDATTVWVEDPTRYEFKMCLRELKNFDGMHRNIHVDWLALEEIPTAWTTLIPYENKLLLPNTHPLTQEQHYSFCKNVNFSHPFYAQPIIIASPSHVSDKNNPKTVYPENNAIAEWLEDISVTGFSVCMKDLQPYSDHHDPVTISYITIGDITPCIHVQCNFFAYCKAYAPRDARCVCQTACPSYEDLVCGDDGRTYQNLCFYQLHVCQTRTDVKILHKGSCVAFIIHRGRVFLQLDTTDVQCKVVNFYPRDFNSSLRVHVQTSINYFNETSPYVHDAAVTWTERISDTSFSVCALKAGRTDRTTPDRGITFVDYIAYQGAPRGAVAGEEKISEWWDGTTCKDISIPKDNFQGIPHILVTAEHMATDLKHDAATVWIEDLTLTSFQICLRELQNFDGLHKDIRVNWIAYSTLPSNMMAEQRLVNFANDKLPLERDNYAFCQVMTFSANYTTPPTVLISAGHSTAIGKAIPLYNSIAPWIEYITTKNCRICVKELHIPFGYDPVTITVLALGEVINAHA